MDIPRDDYAVQSSTKKSKLFWVAGIVLAVAAAGVAVALLTGDSESRNTAWDPLIGYCDHIEPIQKDEFLARQALLVQELQDRDIDAFIMEPGATMTYFGDMSWSLSERPFIMVLTREGDVRYHSPAFEYTRARQRADDGPNHGVNISTWFEDENPYEKLFEELGSPASNYTVAVDPECRFFIPERMQVAFGPDNSFADGLSIVRKLRGRKEAHEIEIMRCANEATKVAHVLLMNELKEGMSEEEVSAMMFDAFRAASLQPRFALVLFGASAALPHGAAGEQLLEDGEMVLVDAGAKLHGYESDVSRTYHFGNTPLTENQINAWDAVHEAQAAAYEAIRPGVTAGSVDQAARDKMRELGYGGNYEYFTHRLGHGIGLQGHEEPYMVRGNDVVLEVNMTFSVEPGIYILEELGVRLEDIVCVTEDGYEVLGPKIGSSIEDPHGDVVIPSTA